MNDTAMPHATSLIHEIRDRIDSYRRKARHNCLWFRCLKGIQILFASAIPLGSIFGVVFNWGTPSPKASPGDLWKVNAVPLVDGSLAFVIVILEGMQQLFQ